MHIPDGLRAGVEHHPAGPAWLASLPDLRDALAERWGLEAVGAPFTAGVAAWTAPARTRTGADVVLKISLPHEEARAEAAALRHWAGRSAVRLLAHDPDRWAVLLVRCRPGTSLAEDLRADDERLLTGARVLAALHATRVVVPEDDEPGAVARPASMADAGAHGADTLERTADTVARAGSADTGVHVDRGQVRAAAELLRTLPGTGPQDVVVHGDLNPGNVLRDDTGPGGEPCWRAIDPKPLVGDPAYDPWPLLSQVGSPFDAADPEAGLRRRATLVADAAGLDAGRVLAWSVARCVQSAYWYVAERRWQPAADELARARVWGRLAG